MIWHNKGSKKPLELSIKTFKQFIKYSKRCKSFIATSIKSVNISFIYSTDRIKRNIKINDMYLQYVKKRSDRETDDLDNLYGFRITFNKSITLLGRKYKTLYLNPYGIKNNKFKWCDRKIKIRRDLITMPIIREGELLHNDFVLNMIFINNERAYKDLQYLIESYHNESL